ncbi:MAG: lipopolysaccharide biosynthesis protein [bacterium]
MGIKNESRTVNAGKNALSALTNKTISLVLSFVSRKFFIQYIGVEYLGINGLFANILTILSLADLGLGTAMNVSLYRPIAENDTDKIAALLGFYKKLYYGIAAGIFVIGMGFLPVLPFLVNLESEIPHLTLYYVLYVLQSSVSYLFVYKSSIIKADQKSYLINKIDLYTNIGCVLLQIVSIVTFKSYLVFLLIGILRVVVHNLTVSLIADHRYAFIKKKVPLDKEEKKEIFSNVSSMFLFKVSYTMINGTDNILMSVLIGTVYVGLYSNYYTLTNNLEAFIALVFTSMTAGVGNLVVSANAGKRYQTFRAMQLFSFWLCGYITVSLFFLLQDFMQLWFGRELLLDDLTVAAIVLNTFFTISMRPVWTFREGTGMFRRIRFVMLATAALNLLLSVLLGKLLGISGILFATSIAKIATYFWYEPKILFRDFFRQKVRRYYGPFLQNILLIILCGGICRGLLSVFHTVSILNWLLKAVICTAVVNGVYWLRYRKTREYSELLKKLKMFLR